MRLGGGVDFIPKKESAGQREVCAFGVWSSQGKEPKAGVFSVGVTVISCISKLLFLQCKQILFHNIDTCFALDVC